VRRIECSSHVVGQRVLTCAKGSERRCSVEDDLLTDNSVVVTNATGRKLYRKRLRNDLTLVITAIKTYRVATQRISVESVHDQFWLVHEMIRAGYFAHLIRSLVLP